MGYYDSLPPSFGNAFTVNDKGASISNFTPNATVADAFQNAEISVDTTGQFNQVADNLTGVRALAPKGGWTFITAPEDIKWEVANSVERVDMFGTNNPPAVAGGRGMRDLSLSNALLEGFVRKVTVEGKVAALENLLNYGINTTDGYVSVPVYQVWANAKSYGGSNAYYVIKSVNVQEKMRDLRGDSTRAIVDVELMQVPAYQVNSGRDQASKNTTKGGDVIKQDAKEQMEQIKSTASTAASTATTTANQNKQPASGPGAGTPENAKPADSKLPTQGITIRSRTP